MRVNSAFTGFFSNRLVMIPAIAIAMPAIFFIALSFTKHSDRDLQVKRVNLIIRQIGHRLLLQAGDSTSRVLPVTEVKEGTFLLKFEHEFIFNHDSLVVLTKSLLPKTQFPSGYTVTVHDCTTGDIAFGFQLNNTFPDILACSRRSQPPGCYTIEFTFNSAQVDPLETKPTPSGFKTTTSGNLLSNVIYGGILLLLCVALLSGRVWKKATPGPVENQNNSIVKKSVPELAALGKFLVDPENQRLLLGSEVISLTTKEYKVLELLNKSFGELVPRETLMQEIWINEGVITGRSLDMFISKLRKKLSHDPELRITNVHGRGYKLEIPGIFNS
ncbi:hypothetical protein A4D02_09605 [Niastella koreensis]|uniref:Transcriptional regulator, winged helix family n=2 Tax=Niastella koreensis TaxID=354356 RepID=G8TN90_NIAKG|nr:winged helix-turn-helix domain-containing protein [Niastella koreensis]AEV98792.1 transcriptional regulator, winged helix family [Niastella koreensis GR20-10]OQP43728.1 hypothetical protein A4D02_09605 [Niastella koreensis]